MSRSTLICLLVAELCFAPAALAAKKGKLEKCLAECESVGKQAEANCKKGASGGRCDGRAKTAFDDFQKQCKAQCEKRNRG